MTKPIDIKRTDQAKPNKGPTTTFTPGRPQEAPKPKAQLTFLPPDHEAVAAAAKEAQKQEAEKEKLFWEQVRRLKHEAEFEGTGAPFLLEEEGQQQQQQVQQVQQQQQQGQQQQQQQEQ